MAAGQKEHLVDKSQTATASHTEIADHDRLANVPPSPNEHEAPALTMSTLCLRFLENVKLHFGDSSQESSTVHRALYEFSQGSVSKREAITMMNGALHDHGELKGDLMAVFDHRDARWSPGDFDSLGVPNEKQDQQSPGPPFLQPPYQPTFSLSPVFLHGSSIPRAGFALESRGFVGPAQQHDNPSDVMHIEASKSHEFSEAQRLSYNRTIPLPSPKSLLEIARSSTFTGSSLDMTLDRRSSQSPFENDSFFHNAQPRTSCTLPQPSSIQTHTGLHHPVEYNDTPQNMFNLPHAFQPEHPNSQLLYPANSLNRSRHTDTSFDHVSIAADYSPGPIKMFPDTLFHANRSPSLTDLAPYQSKELMAPTTGMTSGESIAHVASANSTRAAQIVSVGTFIHAICGKSFSSRSKVKKHHWGNTLNDLNTTTGCWFKHARPNVDWDDDPSCKPAAPKVPSTKRKLVSAKPRQGLVQSQVLEQKAPIAPAMVALPSTSDSRGSANPRTPAPVPSPGDLFQMEEQAVENTRAYHSHRLQCSGSLHSLAAVANCEVPTIEAPKPQGRNNLILSNLNDQAHAGNWGTLVHHTEDWSMPPRTSMPGTMSNRHYTTFSHDSNMDIQEHFFSLSSPTARPLLAHTTQVFQHGSNFSMPPDLFNSAVTRYSRNADASSKRGLSNSPESSPRSKKRRIQDGEWTEEVIVAQKLE